jgi:hypothetical protein
VPHTTCHMEPYCVTTKVCRRVPVCDSCAPSCEMGAPSAVLEPIPAPKAKQE